MDGDFVNIKLLQQLLTPPNDNENSDSEDEHLPSTGIHKFGISKFFCKFKTPCIIYFPNTGPGDIGGNSSQQLKTETASATNSSNYKNVYEKTVDPIAASIEEWDERQKQEDTDALDSRKHPHYTIAYKQMVTTQDVFLQVKTILNFYQINQFYQIH